MADKKGKRVRDKVPTYEIPSYKNGRPYPNDGKQKDGMGRAEDGQNRRRYRADRSGRGDGGRRGGERERENIRVDENLPVRENTYYRKVSDRYRRAGLILILVLVLFMGVMLIRFGTYITYDNFVYLLRDIGSVNGGGDGGNITYGDATGGVFTAFDEGLAVHSNSKMTIYDKTGVELTSKDEIMSYPAMMSGDKYIILFDVGGTDYSVYNTLSRILKGKTDGNIVAASISDIGSFAVTSEGNESRYVTEVYGKALTRVMSIGQDKYVVSSAIGSDGELVATASVSESTVGYGYELSLYKVGESEIFKTISGDMAFPVAVRAVENGGFVLVCDNAIIFISKDGNVTETKSVSADYFDVSRQSVIALSGGDGLGSRDTAYIYNSVGGDICTVSFDEKIIGVAASVNTQICDGYVTDGSSVIRVENGMVAEENKAKASSAVLDISDTGNGVLACCTEVAERLFVNKENN